jgi:polyisoprenoid-binding protein YceI
MKKLHLLSFLFLVALTFVSCKESKKEEIEKTTEEKGYLVDTDNTSINWIAYKTTNKTPVKGTFTDFTIENQPKTTNALEALNQLKFKIPISSLTTNDTIRDGKLIKHFFGNMVNTNEIKGILHLGNNNSGTAKITMNGITQQLQVTYQVNDNLVDIEAVMDLENWKAQAALDALNVVCFDLHKGVDGISKTWSEVKIEISAVLKYE